MPKTVKVRIAVAVDEDGDWFAVGSTRESEKMASDEALAEVDGQGCQTQLFFVEAELPIPEPKTVQATNVETVEE